ncbi:MAG: hypothetical protein HY390_05800 [Deltaproteobacteria bacterium]|nr:hypothetical protein [Deltaproteobacteria bacterium]
MKLNFKVYSVNKRFDFLFFIFVMMIFSGCPSHYYFSSLEESQAAQDVLLSAPYKIENEHLGNFPLDGFGTVHSGPYRVKSSDDRWYISLIFKKNDRYFYFIKSTDNDLPTKIQEISQKDANAIQEGVKTPEHDLFSKEVSTEAKAMLGKVSSVHWQATYDREEEYMPEFPDWFIENMKKLLKFKPQTTRERIQSKQTFTFNFDEDFTYFAFFTVAQNNMNWKWDTVGSNPREIEIRTFLERKMDDGKIQVLIGLEEKGSFNFCFTETLACIQETAELKSWKFDYLILELDPKDDQTLAVQVLYLEPFGQIARLFFHRHAE